MNANIAMNIIIIGLLHITVMASIMQCRIMAHTLYMNCVINDSESMMLDVMLLAAMLNCWLVVYIVSPFSMY